MPAEITVTRKEAALAIAAALGPWEGRRLNVQLFASMQGVGIAVSDLCDFAG